MMHQEQFILDVVEEYELSEAKTVGTSADINAHLRKDDGVSKKVDATLYQSMEGSLLYIAVTTRPDVAQTGSCVKIFLQAQQDQSDYSETHFLSLESNNLKFTQSESETVQNCWIKILQQLNLKHQQL